MNSQKKKSAQIFSGWDLAALLLCAGVFGYLFFIAGKGMDSIDESFYYTIALRILNGDRFLVDEWHVSQLSAIFQILPLRLYTAITGSTDGVILFLRYFYLCVDFILYWYFYIKLRERKLSAAVSCALFCSFAFFGIYTFGYYTMGPQALAVLGMILFVNRKNRAPKLLFAGLLTACAVLIEPTLIFVYAVYSALVLTRTILRKKGRAFLEEYAFATDGRVWLYLTAGAAACAVVFLVYLGVSSGFSEIVKNQPELFTDTEYQFRWYGNKMHYRYIRTMLDSCNALPFFGLLAMVPVCALLKRYKNNAKRNAILFLIACALFLACGISVYHMIVNLPSKTLLFMQFQQLPLILFGLISYILSENKNRRLFAFWCLGFVSSVCVDYFSEIAFGYAGALTYFFTVPCAADNIGALPDAFRKSQPKKSGEQSASPAEGPKKRVRAALCILVAALFLCETGKLFVAGSVNLVENAFNGISVGQPLSATLDTGPLKGIRTTASHKEIYDGILADLDLIKKDCDGPFYVAGLCCYAYLYVDSPVAAYSTAYNEEENIGRQERYWELHPEKIPEYIYIPKYHFMMFDDLGTTKVKKVYFYQKWNCETTEGKAGCILKVISPKTES